MKITAVVITKNEERNIGRCLQSLQGVADELLVVDSFSTDRTLEICAEMGAKVVQTEWKGYSATKNYANSLAENDWILSLDADEALNPELREAILAQKKGPQAGAFLLTRRTCYCGKWIYHSGWNPDRKVRLFDRRTARWSGDFVHETLQTDPGIAIAQLPGLCYHYTVYTVREHLETVNKYSELQAREMLKRGKRASGYHLVVKPFAEFFRSYFIKGGFRDGREGLIISCVNAFAKFLKYAKLIVLQRQSDGTYDGPPPTR